MDMYQNEDIKLDESIDHPDHTIQEVRQWEKKRHVLHTLGFDNFCLQFTRKCYTNKLETMKDGGRKRI